MSKYFAQINKGIVQRVIVADTKEWCQENLGGTWIETFTDNPDKKYAGIGHTYDEVNDRFIAPKPYESWVLTPKGEWTSPIKRPENLSGKNWSEKDLVWKSISEVQLEKNG